MSHPLRTGIQFALIACGLLAVPLVVTPDGTVKVQSACAEGTPVGFCCEEMWSICIKEGQETINAYYSKGVCPGR